MASHRGAVKVPKYNEFHWPVIRALKETGGSASIAELYERVVADMNLGEDVLAVPHGDGTTSEVEYRLAWARTYLKKVGAIDNSERGVWALTSKGRAFTEKDAADVVKQVRSQFRKQGQPEIVPSEEMEVKADEAEISWKESLLGVLKSMSPAGFERLSQRISARKRLHESGSSRTFRGRRYRRCWRSPHEPRVVPCPVSVQTMEGRCLSTSRSRLSRSNDWASRQRIDNHNWPFYLRSST